MSITFPHPPNDSVSELKTKLAGVLRSSLLMALTSSFHTLDSSDLKISFPHQVHNARLDDLADATGLKNPIFGSWRYILSTSPSGPVLVAEVNALRDGSHIFAQLCNDPLCQGLLDEFGRVLTDPSIPDRSFSAHVLRAPALGVAFIWLKDQGGNQDVFISLPSATEIAQGVQYTTDELTGLLQRIAKDKLAHTTDRTS